MAVVWVTVPTRGRETLVEAIDSTGVPRDRTVIVVTTPGVAAPEGCHVVEDFGEINIHRWWNAGIDYAAERGATHVLVINDDVVLNPGTTVRALLDEMSSAAIASPGAGGVIQGWDFTSRVMDGSCWLLDLSTGLRPDEGFRWWYGDNDLDRRARRDYGGVASIRCDFMHTRPNHLTATSPELQALADRDRERWEASCAG